MEPPISVEASEIQDAISMFKRRQEKNGMVAGDDHYHPELERAQLLTLRVLSNVSWTTSQLYSELHQDKKPWAPSLAIRVGKWGISVGGAAAVLAVVLFFVVWRSSGLPLSQFFTSAVASEKVENIR